MNGFLKGFIGGPMGWTMPECNINRLAEAGVLASLRQDNAHLEKVKELNRDAREYLYTAFDQMGLEYIPSEANFVMVNAGIDGDVVKERLLEQGILVQAGGSYHPDYQNWLRVSTGTMDEMKVFINVLSDILT